MDDSKRTRLGFLGSLAFHLVIFLLVAATGVFAVLSQTNEGDDIVDVSVYDGGGTGPGTGGGGGGGGGNGGAEAVINPAGTTAAAAAKSTDTITENAKTDTASTTQPAAETSASEQGQQDAGNQPARRAEPGQSQQAQQHGQQIEAAVERGRGWLQMCVLKDAVEHMAQHFHIRDQARIKADGGCEFFAKTCGSGSNQHVFAAKSDRWDIAAQDVDIGVGGERRAQAVLAVPRSLGKSDELGLQLLPGVGCNRVCWRWGRWGWQGRAVWPTQCRLSAICHQSWSALPSCS